MPRSSVSYSSTAPTRRRSEVAEPPTATAWSGCSISTPSKRSSMRSRTLRTSEADGGSEAISSSASAPEPTGQERTFSAPPRDRAEDDLGRAAADVDDADPALDRVAKRLGRADEGKPTLLLLAEDVDREAGRRRRPPRPPPRCCSLRAPPRSPRRGSPPRPTHAPAAPGSRQPRRPPRSSRARSPPQRQSPCRFGCRRAAPSPCAAARPRARRRAHGSCSTQYLWRRRASRASLPCSQTSRI